MDAFTFDQRFARLLSQMDSEAIREGMKLYKSEEGTLLKWGQSRFEATILDGEDKGFSVVLVENGDGGFSGSCSCPANFNCRHSYALARLARDRIVGNWGKAKTVEKKASKPECRSDLAGRIFMEGTEDAKALCAKLERLWKIAERSNFLLYPKDLNTLLSGGQKIKSPPGEPLRALKRKLESGRLKSSAEFADALKSYFKYKGIECSIAFSELTREGKSKVFFDVETTDGSSGAAWDVETLKYSYELRIEPMIERDWFQLSAHGVVEDGGYSDDEIRRLLAAEGRLVKIPGKGWKRLELVEEVDAEAAFASLGIDPLRGNSQRVHLTQIEDLLPQRVLQDQAMKDAIERARTLCELPLPTVPKILLQVLRPYQIDGFRYLCNLSSKGFGGILADDMGLGKTLQALAWMLWHKERLASGKSLRVLVVCPKSVIDNWIREPAAFKTGLSSVRYEAKHASSVGCDDSNIVVANYAQLRIRSEYFLSQSWDIVVLDEGQYIKSPSSQTTKVAWKLKAAQRLVLTGTPIENRLTDLWSLMRFAMPRLLGPQAAFSTNYNVVRNPNALEGLRKRIQPFMLRRLKSQVAKDLPARIEKEIYCDLEGEQKELYQAELLRARSALKMAKEGKGKSGFNVLQTLLRMRQICCDPRLIDSGFREKRSSSKVEALLDLIEPLVAEGHKVLVFSQFVSMLKIIERVLTEKEIPSLKLTGETQNRMELVDRFQNTNSENVFLLSLKAAGSGLNLTAASYVVLFDPWWNPAVEAQAIDRAHRIGQDNTVIAYRILAKDTIEEKIRDIQNEKADLAESIVGESTDFGSLNLDTIEELLN